MAPGAPRLGGRLPRAAKRADGLNVGRAHRLVVGYVRGPGLAGARVALLIRVEPVVGPVGSRLAAHGARPDLLALGGDAVALGRPDPDPDHDREHGDVNH